MSREFWQQCKENFDVRKSCVVVGLDPVVDKMPGHFAQTTDGIESFLHEIIDATFDFACCYKPNLAYFLAQGTLGIKCLENVCAHASHTKTPVILDAKFNDIGHTAQLYASFAKNCGADAVTLNAYIGSDCVKQFVEKKLAPIVLCITSNPSFEEIEAFGNDIPLYLHMAQMCDRWIDDIYGPNSRYHEKIGLVVGATHPKFLEKTRQTAPFLPFLIPGIGAQGGDMHAAAKFGFTADGFPPLVNASRSILYASREKDFAHAARNETQKLAQQLNVSRDN